MRNTISKPPSTIFAAGGINADDVKEGTRMDCNLAVQCQLIKEKKKKKLSNIDEKERKRASMPEPVNHQVNAARKTFQTLYQISKLLNTNLDPTTLSICIRLCENGVNPHALATVVKELQREVKALNDTQLESHASKTSANK